MKNLTKNTKIRPKNIIYLVLIILWMSLVFYFSHQPGDTSGNTSSSATEIIVNIITLGQEYNTEQKAILIERLNPIVRKLAHYSIYTLGGFLIINYLNIHIEKDKKKILYSIVFGAIYAVTDEFHQYFIIERTASFFDVCIDTLGIITGVYIFMFLEWIIRKKKCNTIES